MKITLLFTTVSALVFNLSPNAFAFSINDFHDTDSIKWAEGKWEGADDGLYHGTVELSVFPAQMQYFNYTYTKPEGYETITGNDNRVTNPNNDLNKIVFKDIVSDGSLFSKDSYYSYYGGGAVFNHENNHIISITSDFLNNAITRRYHNNQSYGGAILNTGTLKNITGNFIGNFSSSQATDAAGGAIANFDAIERVSGDFIGNFAISNGSPAAGGAIFNNGVIDTLSNNFIGNYSKSVSLIGSISLGGAIYNGYNNTIKNLSGDFIGNYTLAGHYAHGGGIYNYGTINNISSDFIGNHIEALNSSSGYYSEGGAITNTGTIEKISGTFNGNYVISNSGVAQGGAIYNSYKIDNIINSIFINNYVSGIKNTSGGAIYSQYDIKISADNGKSEFTDNYVLIKDTVATEDVSMMEDQKIPNAIYMASDSSTLNLNVVNKGEILLNDEIDGQEGYKIALGGDNTGTITFNNNIRNANITLNDTNAYLNKVEFLKNNNNLTINSGVFNINKFQIGEQLTANSIVIENDGLLNFLNSEVTLDEKKPEMGTIDGNVLTVNGAGKININNMLIQKDGKEGETYVPFIVGDKIPVVDATVQMVVAPVYKYKVTYKAETGEFIFTRGDKIFTSSVPATPVVLMSNYRAFNPGVFANDIAASNSANTQEEAIAQVFETPRIIDYSKARIWATPYYSDDTLGFSNFYDVDSKSYGLIAGVDTRAFGNPDGWNSVYTLFGAYNDGENKYQGVKVDSKSWLVGLKASVYNGGFYGDALMNYAWHDSDQTTAFGKDSVDSTGYGAALKTGYKHEFKNRMSVDTSAMLSWQEVQGEDFTSKSGARISTDDYSRLTLTPQVKLGYSFEHVKPYALVRYNFVLDEDGSSTVNNIALPTIESKDYVEYGLGVETTDAFPHGGYAHVLRHDGGRSGWSVTAGYRFNF